MSAQTTTAAKRQILVTGATGRVGSQTINELAHYYSDRFDIVAGVRSKSEKAQEQRHWAGSTRAIYIDAEEHTSLAFNNIDILFIIPSSRQDRVKHAKAYVDAAIQNKVSFILLLSIVLPRDENILFAKQFNEMENYVATCNIPNCFLRCGYFQQNFLLQADENVIRLPINAGHMSPLNVIDVARAACSIFMDPQVHAGKAYDLVGPDVLNGDGIAKAASKGLGREIRFANVSSEEFQYILEKRGMEPWQAKDMVELMELYRADKFIETLSNKIYENLIGLPGITLEKFFEMNASYFSPEKSNVTVASDAGTSTTETTGGRRESSEYVGPIYAGRRECIVDNPRLREINHTIDAVIYQLGDELEQAIHDSERELREVKQRVRRAEDHLEHLKKIRCETRARFTELEGNVGVGEPTRHMEGGERKELFEKEKSGSEHREAHGDESQRAYSDLQRRSSRRSESKSFGGEGQGNAG